VGRVTNPDSLLIEPAVLLAVFVVAPSMLFLAPLIFSMPVEYPIAIVLACLMRPVTSQEKATGKWFRIILMKKLSLISCAVLTEEHAYDFMIQVP
jgi:hypothetical protein